MKENIGRCYIKRSRMVSTCLMFSRLVSKARP